MKYFPLHSTISVNPFSKHLSLSAFMSALPFTDAINTPILSFSLTHLPFLLEWEDRPQEKTDVEILCGINKKDNIVRQDDERTNK